MSMKNFSDIINAPLKHIIKSPDNVHDCKRGVKFQ
jgi:hypothetical protein